MDVPRALDQIAEIHSALARANVYRGYRSIPVAASGLTGFAAAWLQPATLSIGDPSGFVRYWTIAAIVAGTIGASEILYNYAVNDDHHVRRRTRQVTGQFVPSLLAGGFVTVSMLHLNTALVPLLPGLWAVFFGLGVFASRPFLPKAAGWVALFYSAVGVYLLWTAESPHALSGWHVGLTFGFGQLFAAAVLYWQIERPSANLDERE